MASSMSRYPGSVTTAERQLVEGKQRRSVGCSSLHHRCARIPLDGVSPGTLPNHGYLLERDGALGAIRSNRVKGVSPVDVVLGSTSAGVHGVSAPSSASIQRSVLVVRLTDFDVVNRENPGTHASHSRQTEVRVGRTGRHDHARDARSRPQALRQCTRSGGAGEPPHCTSPIRLGRASKEPPAGWRQPPAPQPRRALRTPGLRIAPEESTRCLSTAAS